MINRSFRDRYAAVLPQSVTSRVVPTESSDWPLPNGATLVESPFGVCVTHDSVYVGEPIREARDRLLRSGGARSDTGVELSSMLFLDTETTGLSGGTGTHVFLIGVGRFIEDTFHVCQLFMRHPGDERAVLNTLAASIHSSARLVTYNGRSFDVPLLETRYMMHGWRFGEYADHLDMLPQSRAIWKYRLPNCTLGTLERMILGVTRESDAPGWMIPQLYFNYLRTRDITSLEPVFEHNRADIVSLARLTAVVRAFESRSDVPENDIDRVALALYGLRRRQAESAVSDLLRLWRAPTVPSDLRLRAVRELTSTLKRQQRHEEAAAVWRAGLNDPSRAIRLFALEELAKYFEHRVRDLQSAREIAQRGVDGAMLAHDSTALQSFERRLQRLERKLVQRH